MKSKSKIICRFLILIFLLMSMWQFNFFKTDRLFSNRIINEKNNNEFQEWLSSMEKRFQERSSRAFKICKHYKAFENPHAFIQNTDSRFNNMTLDNWRQLRRLNSQNLFYNSEQNIAYCKVNKCGSTNWVNYLLHLAGLLQPQIDDNFKIHKIIRDYYPREKSSVLKQHLKTAFKLVVVRHPFSRILAAYRDKLENYQRDLKFRDGYYHEHFGRYIVRNFRDSSDASKTNRDEPTWREFIRYIIKTPVTSLDLHWRPIFAVCSPCAIKFDAIVKLEHYSEEIRYIFHVTGLKEKLEPIWLHKNNNNTSSLLKLYFNQLSKEEINKLYEIYKLDFELFGYKFGKYGKPGNLMKKS
ncbi:UNVERIFIED_CONTAM: hypothetical protein RMT77_017351 [Armadillidium vulgare]